MSNEANQVDGRYTFSTETRMVFQNLAEPRAVGKKGKAKGEPKYSGTFIFTPDNADLKAIKELAAKVAKARWPGRPLSELKFPFTTGEKKIEREKKAAEREGRKPRDQKFFEGMIVLDARSKYQPQCAAVVAGKVVQLEGAAVKQKFYNGCYAVPKINLVPYEGQAEDGVGNPDGVTAYLDAVLFAKDGPKIGGGNAAETFKAYAGSMTAADPGSDTDGDEIPF